MVFESGNVMKSLVVFDTKYGSTKKVAEWIGEGLGESTQVKSVNEVESLDYDLIVAGSPIYGGKPLESIQIFLEKNKEILAKKTVAQFLVCGDHPYSDLASLVQQFLQDFTKKLVKEPVAIQAFGGYLDLKNLDEKAREGMLAFWKSRGWHFKVMDNLNREEAIEFGKKLQKICSSC